MIQSRHVLPLRSSVPLLTLFYRTQQHQRECVGSSEAEQITDYPFDSLRELNTRITDSVALVNAPPSAAARIERRPFASLVESRWNREVETLFRGFYSWDNRLQQWYKDVFYGTKL